MKLDQVLTEFKSGNVTLLDIRETNEWNSNHIKGAKTLPLSKITAGNIPPELDKDSKYYIYCAGAIRTIAAAALLKSFGFKNVTRLKRGFAELLEFGFPSSKV